MTETNRTQKELEQYAAEVDAGIDAVRFSEDEVAAVPTVARRFMVTLSALKAFTMKWSRDGDAGVRVPAAARQFSARTLTQWT